MKVLKKCIPAILLLLAAAAFLLYFRQLQATLEKRLYSGRDAVPTLYIADDKPLGEMKPLHGINNGPKSGYSETEDGEAKWELNATILYQQAGIPVVRTHDTEYPYGQDHFIDIHCIFPDFSRDPDDPSAYNFLETDQYISAIIESGAQVLFRLGESIDHSGENLYINPPEDYEKWARICEHIIRHYNEGWADGFHYNIVYWEIWNEPDNSSMWTGTLEDYYELYCITASYLKEIYPDILIGGGAFSDCSSGQLVPFLQYIGSGEEKIPLDFLSWHLYSTEPSSYFYYGNEVRTILDENGYTETMNFLDEWNYVADWNDLEGAWETISSSKGASFNAATLISMQNSAIGSAMYYDGQYVFADAWCGLYDAQAQEKPGYYAFYYFNRLYCLGTQVHTEGEAENIYLCAASGKDGTAALLTNYSSGPDDRNPVTVRLTFSSSASGVSITRINDSHPGGKTTEKYILSNSVYLKIYPNDVIYVELI